jgi:hypothetical protein
MAAEYLSRCASCAETIRPKDGFINTGCKDYCLKPLCMAAAYASVKLPRDRVAGLSTAEGKLVIHVNGFDDVQFGEARKGNR